MTEGVSGPTSSGVQPAVNVTEGATSPSGSASGYDSTTQVTSMKDLKEKAPEVHQAMVKGIAQSIISDMRQAQERLKKKMREMYK